MAGGDAGLLKWVTLFDNKGDEDGGKNKIKIPEIPDFDLPDKGVGGNKNSKKSDKRLSVERIYQKKTQLEHILLRPDTYIGSVETLTQPMWVYDDMNELMVQRDLTFVPGLYKIFDEILVNAADNKQRDPKMNCIRIDIDPENNKIKIWNNGKGIPIVEHKTEKMYVPTMIFGHLLTSSNYDDSQKKVTGGRNGYGAKLCNIFSTKFIVETQAQAYKKSFKQTWADNMLKATEPKISPSSHGEDFTCVTFYPDLAKFKMTSLDKDIVDLFSRRAYDIAACSKGVKVFLNGKKVPIKNFKDYVDLFIKDKVDDNGSPLKLVHEVCTDRWEIAVTLSEKGFQQMSFVNSIATTKGGRHADYITDQIVAKIIEVVKKKEKKGSAIAIKPFQVRNHVWVFVNCLIENPTFDSQTKENMTLMAKSFGSKCSLSDKFTNAASKCGIVESIQSWMKFKAQEKLNKKCSSSKHSKLRGIPKLDDANNAGTRNSLECTLILTEGDSAKSLAVAGLGVVGRDRYGVFPLKGKVLNVREASHKQIMENAEINNIIKIMGLRYKEKYENPDQLKTLRYGKIMIMTDQDQDGSHIKGLLINFIHHNWPNLLKHNILEEFITPIVKVTKGKQTHAFYSLPEFAEWKRDTDNWHTWKVKYYKGLGTSTPKEAKEYFQDMNRHRIPFEYEGTEDDAAILLAFSKKKVEERKEWLTNWMEERKRRAQLGLPETFLYGAETKKVTFNDFVNRELILFSNMDNVRSIPSLLDGLKPGQRKVLFTCFKRNIIKEIKVAQLAGSVGELSAYHHGENSLMATIINLAQNFIGSNNINMLQPIGQFGTRLHGGRDAASPRYIFTLLSTLSRHLYNVNDDALLNAQFEDSQKIEPEWYIPIIPMVLVNGTDGIGTGWSTKIPNYDPREIARNIKRMLQGEEPLPMLPFFKNFNGTIEEIDAQRYVVNGEVNILDDNSVEITELPIRSWTQAYKEGVLEPMLHGSDKVPAMIQDYKEYHTDTTVRFVVKMAPEKLAQAEDAGLHKVFKLQTTISIGTMVLFDSSGCIKRYSSVLEIMREFFTVRLEYYQKRKDYLEGMLAAESLKMDNIARFICEKIDGIIIIENIKKKDIIQMLVRRGYDPDPIKVWKETQSKLQDDAGEPGSDNEDDSQSSASGTSGDYNYLLTLPILSLTKEKKDELLKNRDAKAEELYQLRKKTPKDMWKIDLASMLEELDKVEVKEKEDEVLGVGQPVKTAKGRPKYKKMAIEETKPSPMGRRVEPIIDPSLRAKSAAVAAKKRKLQEKKEAGFKIEDDMFGEDDDMPKSLADRLGSIKEEKPPKKAAAARKPREKKPSGGGTPKKKGKKANPWSEEDEGSDDLSDGSDGLDLDGSYSVEPRNRGPRRTAVNKAKYTFSEDEKSDVDGEEEFIPTQNTIESTTTVLSDDDGSFHPVNSDDNDSDFSVSAPPPKKKAAPSKPKEKPKPLPASDSEDDWMKTTQSTVSSTLSKGFNNRADSPLHGSDSGDDDAIFNPSPPPAPKEEPKKKKTLGKKQTSALGNKADGAAKKKPAVKRKKGSDIDLSDDDEFVPKAKKPAPKKKAAPKKKVSSDMSDLSDDGFASKKPAPKKKGKKKTSDDEDYDEVVPKKSKSKAAKKKVDSDEDDLDIDMDDVAPRAPRGGAGRSKPPIKYNFGDSDGSDDDDDY